MDANWLVEKVVGAVYEVANTLGSGFLEKVYERAWLLNSDCEALSGKRRLL
ncbi:MAG: GxxExxY protein [Acidobacteria bacterium]|nr:GxxExxY protein [Acidobacteriota bacterium]